MTERSLKRLAIHAVKSFEVEVKAGQRTSLTADELNPVNEDDEEEEEEQPVSKRPSMRRGVRQTKIVRAQDRVDAVSGKGRSKGYGFLEMHSHADALRVLRWTNNNAEVHALFQEWWKDELGDLVKMEKAKVKKGRKDGEEEDAESAARLKRLENELDGHKVGGKKAGGSQNLIVEFSIENIQVVRRREDGFKRQAQNKVCVFFLWWFMFALTYPCLQGCREKRHKVCCETRLRWGDRVHCETAAIQEKEEGSSSGQPSPRGAYESRSPDWLYHWQETKTKEIRTSLNTLVLNK